MRFRGQREGARTGQRAVPRPTRGSEDKATRRFDERTERHLPLSGAQRRDLGEVGAAKRRRVGAPTSDLQRGVGGTTTVVIACTLAPAGYA